MLSTFPLLQYLLIVSAGWVHRQQLEVIDYLQEENRVLRQLLGDKRLRFTDAQRRRLAEKANHPGRFEGGRMRRAWRRSALGRVLPQHRARLRELLPLSRADCTVGRSPSGALKGFREIEVIDGRPRFAKHSIDVIQRR